LAMQISVNKGEPEGTNKSALGSLRILDSMSYSELPSDDSLLSTLDSDFIASVCWSGRRVL
jgi:hypothetical protein